MFIGLLRIMARPAARLGILVYALIFLSSGLVFAQNVSSQNLSRPGTLLAVSKAASYPSFTGIRFDPDNPLKLRFLADSEGKNFISQSEASRLVYYFLAGLTLPEDELWVNLSPYEQDRVAGDHLAVTDLGRDMLAQDYLLKQLVASLTYPESDGGKSYWSSVYDAVFKKLGTTNIAVNSFNKVWITPGRIRLYEKGSTAYIASASLKVMTDFDYNALKNNLSETVDPTVEITARALREKLIPVITKEVNHGENFAPLRQIYRSLILAVWFKKKFKESFYKSYIGAAKVKGIDLAEKNFRDKIFNLYVEAFKKGSYDYIRHDYDKHIKKRLRRRYYSGGVVFGDGAMLAAMGDTSVDLLPSGEAPTSVERVQLPDVARDTVVTKIPGGKGGSAAGIDRTEVDYVNPSTADMPVSSRETSTKVERVQQLDREVHQPIPGTPREIDVEFVLKDGDLVFDLEGPMPVVTDDPFELTQAISDSAVQEELARYRARRTELAAAVREGDLPSLSADNLAFIARSDMAMAYAKQRGPDHQLGPNRYALTPYMRAWLSSASDQQLAKILKDTAFLDREEYLYKTWSSPDDQEMARGFGVYFWLCAMEQVKRRTDARVRAGAAKEKAGGDFEELLQGHVKDTDNAAAARQRFAATGAQFTDDFPESVDQPGRYRIFAGGLGAVLAGDDGYSFKLTLPAKGTANPRDVANEGAVSEAAIVDELNQDGISGPPQVVGRFVAPNGSIGVKFKDAVVRGDALPSSDYLAKLGGLPLIRAILKVSVDTTRTVAEANSKGTVHRDIKPSNILIDHTGKSSLADWGLAVKGTDNRVGSSESYEAPEVRFKPVFTPEQLSRKFGSAVGSRVMEILVQHDCVKDNLIQSPYGGLIFDASLLVRSGFPQAQAEEIFKFLEGLYVSQYKAWRETKDAPTLDAFSLGKTINVMLGNLINDPLGYDVGPVDTAVEGGAWNDPRLPEEVRKELGKVRVLLEGVIRDLTVHNPHQRLWAGGVLGRLQYAEEMMRKLVSEHPEIEIAASARSSEHRSGVRIDPGDPTRYADVVLGRRAFVNGKGNDKPTTVATAGPWAHEPDLTVIYDTGIHPSPAQADEENGGIDFNYANFDIKADTGNQAVNSRYSGVKYDGIALKEVTTQRIDPSTSVAAWAAGK